MSLFRGETEDLERVGGTNSNVRLRPGQHWRKGGQTSRIELPIQIFQMGLDQKRETRNERQVRLFVDFEISMKRSVDGTIYFASWPGRKQRLKDMRVKMEKKLLNQGSTTAQESSSEAGKAKIDLLEEFAAAEEEKETRSSTRKKEDSEKQEKDFVEQVRKRSPGWVRFHVKLRVLSCYDRAVDRI